MTVADDTAAALILARAIVSHIPGWYAEVSEHGNGAYLGHPRGPRVHLQIDRGAVDLTGERPRLSDRSLLHDPDAWVRSHCLVRTGAEKIARHIQTKLLPKYLAAYEEEATRVRAIEGTAAEARSVADRLASAVGGQRCTSGWRDRGPLSEVHVTHNIEGVARVRVAPHWQTGEPRVSFEVNGLSPEVAAEVLAIIGAADTERPPVRVDVGAAESGVELGDEDLEVVNEAPQLAAVGE